MKLANTSDLKSDDESLAGSNPAADTNWIAWAAGLFEGEGSAYMVTQRTRGVGYNYPRLELKMTDEDVVRKFHKVVGVGRVRYYKPASRPSHWKPAWAWYCSNIEDCRKVIDMIWPYLGKRRRDKIIELEL